MQEGLTLCSVLEVLSNVADLIKYCTTAGEGHSLVQSGFVTKYLITLNCIEILQ